MASCKGRAPLTGTLAGLPFTTPFTLHADTQPHTGAVGSSTFTWTPIHLSLLGLHVDTSPICLDITANHGGGLLGNLLCGLSDNLAGILADPIALQT